MSIMNFNENPAWDRCVLPDDYQIINGSLVKLDEFNPDTQYVIPFENGSLLIADRNVVASLRGYEIKTSADEIEYKTLIESSLMKSWLCGFLTYLDNGAPIIEVGYGYGFLVRTPEGGFNGMLSNDFHYLTIQKEYDCVNGCRTFATNNSVNAIRSMITSNPFKPDVYWNMISKYPSPYSHGDKIIFEGSVLIYGPQVIPGNYIHRDGTVRMPQGPRMEYQTVGNYNPSEIKPTHRGFLCD